MSHSDDNQDWDFSDSEEEYRSDQEHGRGDPSKSSQPPREGGLKKESQPVQPSDPNQKKSDLQELVEADDHERPRYGDRGDRRGRRGDRGDRGDRDRGDRDYRRGGGGYRDRDRGGGRPRMDKEFSNYSSTLTLPKRRLSSKTSLRKSLAKPIS